MYIGRHPSEGCIMYTSAYENEMSQRDRTMHTKKVERN